MPLSPRPLHSNAHPHPAEAPSGFKEWSSHVAASARPGGQTRTAQHLVPGVDVTHPLFKVAAVAFVGYTLGRLIHRRDHHVDLPPPPRPSLRPRTMPEPSMAYPGRPINEQRSSIRFR